MRKILCCIITDRIVLGVEVHHIVARQLTEPSIVVVGIGSCEQHHHLVLGDQLHTVVGLLVQEIITGNEEQ